MCAKVCLNSVLAVTKYTFLQDSKYCPRALTQLQQVRERKRTCKAPPWFVKKKAGSFWHERELTWDNRAFLQELVEDKYVPKVAELSQRGSPLKDGPWERKEWTPKTLRTGVLAVKIGVIPQWSTDGKKFFTTLLQVLDNHVIRYVPPEEFQKYESYKENWKGHFGMAVLGALSCDPMKFTKDYNNLFLEAGVPPKRKLTRFLVTPDAALQPGTPLTAMHFRVGDYVDVQAKTIGHGFQGVVKRWGFKGGPASHGTTKWHRRPGSIGGGGDSSRVWPGKKMPGHMGMDWQTLKGLKIWRINTKYNVLYVHGPCVPGPNHCYVRVMDTKLRYRREELKERAPPMPTYYKDDSTEPLPEEIFDERLHRFTQPTITYDTSK